MSKSAFLCAAMAAFVAAVVPASAAPECGYEGQRFCEQDTSGQYREFVCQKVTGSQTWPIQTGKVCPPVQASPGAWLNGIAGRYEGSLVNAGKPTPVSTEINVGPNQTVSGSYSFVESDVRVGGSLNSCVTAGARSVSCQWRDRYGTGTLQMNFSGDLRSFNGQWSASDEPGKWFSWSGRR